MDSNVDLVIKAIKAANRKPVTTIEIVRATGLTKQQARSATSNAANNKAYKIVRLAKGVFCYDPPEGTIAYDNRFEVVVHLLNKHKELEKEELAEELNIAKHNVHSFISKAKQKYGLKVKRHVVYRLE